jgi:ABC-type multidrug transport system ATPase subunit
VIHVTGLSKRFGKLQVLRGLDLRSRPAASRRSSGPNGAGKTTLIKSVLGLVRPDGGTIEVGGVRVDGAATTARGSATCRRSRATRRT